MNGWIARVVPGLVLVGVAGCAAPSPEAGGLATAPATDAPAPATEDAARPAPDIWTPDDDAPDAVWTFLASKYDADADGRVGVDEYTRDAGAFARLDRDGDGTITASDFDVGGGPGGGMPSMAAMRSRMGTMIVSRYFQADGDESELDPDELVEAFHGYDADGDGSIDADEFDARAETIGAMPMMGMDRFEILASSVDDEDGLITSRELLTYFHASDSNGDGVWTMGGGAPAPGSGGHPVARGSAEDAAREDDEAPRTREPATADAGPPEIATEGDVAPDFRLEPMHGGEPVTLSSHAGEKPVALIFGSYT